MASFSYSVVFSGTCKLGINFRVTDGHVLEVFNFCRPEGDEFMSPAEACGKISCGDVLVGINSVHFESYHIEEQLALLGVLQWHGAELPGDRTVVLHFLRKPIADALRRYQVRRETKMLVPRGVRVAGATGAAGARRRAERSAPPRSGDGEGEASDGDYGTRKHAGRGGRKGGPGAASMLGDGDQVALGSIDDAAYDAGGGTARRGRRGRGGGRKAGGSARKPRARASTSRAGRAERKPLVTPEGTFEAPSWTHEGAEDEFRRIVDAKRSHPSVVGEGSEQQQQGQEGGEAPLDSSAAAPSPAREAADSSAPAAPSEEQPAIPALGEAASPQPGANTGTTEPSADAPAASSSATAMTVDEPVAGPATEQPATETTTEAPATSAGVPPSPRGIPAPAVQEAPPSPGAGDSDGEDEGEGRQSESSACISKSELARRMGVKPSNYISWASGKLRLRPSCGQILRTWGWLRDCGHVDEGEWPVSRHRLLDRL